MLCGRWKKTGVVYDVVEIRMMFKVPQKTSLEERQRTKRKRERVGWNIPKEEIDGFSISFHLGI